MKRLFVPTFINQFIAMNSYVFRLTNYNKVFYSIVVFNSIYVMNLVAWIKIMSNIIFHYKSVFKDIAIKRFEGMISRSSYVNISVSIKIFSTFPIRIIFTTIKRRKAFFPTSVGTEFLSIPLHISILRMFRKLFITYNTSFNFNHNAIIAFG